MNKLSSFEPSPDLCKRERAFSDNTGLLQEEPLQDPVKRLHIHELIFRSIHFSSILCHAARIGLALSAQEQDVCERQPAVGTDDLPGLKT